MKEHEIPVRCKKCNGRTYFEEDGLCEDCGEFALHETKDDNNVKEVTE